MNRFSSWWYKHFHLVYLFISILLLGSFTHSSSESIGDEPTEEPEESIISTRTTVSLSKENDSSTLGAENLPRKITKSRSNGSARKKTSLKINETSSTERHDQHHARGFLHSSGSAWKVANTLLRKGLRMFRESLLEGAKVAHMFKEDVDEGVQNVMRQNRGIKKMDGQVEVNKNDSGSFFDSQMLREGLVGGILRFMGINSKQMGVIALNVLIILAEWITSSMIGNKDVSGATSRMIKTNLLQWANTGHNAQVENILKQAKSHTLPEKLIDKLSHSTGNSTSCVQLLICKMSPVIWGFQDTVKDQMKAYGFHEETAWRTAASNTDSYTGFENDKINEDYGTGDEPRGFLAMSQNLIDKFLGRLPPKERMVDFGDRCETKFPNCQLLKL